MLQRAITILWPSFLVAGVAESVTGKTRLEEMGGVVALGLGFLAGLLLLAAASQWLQVSRLRDHTARVSSLGRAASITALALGLSGIALVTAFAARFF